MEHTVVENNTNGASHPNGNNYPSALLIFPQSRGSLRLTDNCGDNNLLGLITTSLGLGDPTRTSISDLQESTRMSLYLTSICSPWLKSLSTSDARGIA
jgi:hypothetical protein